MITKSPYVIINDCDAPKPQNVCQWVEGIGYCYLNRRDGRGAHDGMAGIDATPIEAFGFVWTDNKDGTVSFYMSDRPSTATYSDGVRRPWQSPINRFNFLRLLYVPAFRKRVGMLQARGTAP